MKSHVLHNQTYLANLRECLYFVGGKCRAQLTTDTTERYYTPTDEERKTYCESDGFRNCPRVYSACSPAVSSLMQPGVVSVETGATVSGVARLMAEKSIRNIFVMRKGEPIGVVRDWDIVTRVVALNLDSNTVKVDEMMHTPVASVKADAEVAEIAAVMAETGVRRVLVMAEGKVLGTITAEALLSHYGLGSSLTVEP